jgi:hypothetical protein
MSDFVDLTCPSCGDTLQLPNGNLRTVCRSCGRVFAARPQANGTPLVSHACCPICGQNDRVEKLVAIVTRETQQTQGATLQQRRWRDQRGRWHVATEQVPFVTSQASALAQRLAAPVEPPAVTTGQSSKAMAVWILAIVLGALGLCVGVSNKETSMALACGVLPLVGGILALVLTARQRKAKQVQETAQVEFARERWQKAKARWDQAYYCGRDDCVFIPGEAESVPSHDLARLLYVR